MATTEVNIDECVQIPEAHPIPFVIAIPVEHEVVATTFERQQIIIYAIKLNNTLGLFVFFEMATWIIYSFIIQSYVILPIAFSLFGFYGAFRIERCSLRIYATYQAILCCGRFVYIYQITSVTLIFWNAFCGFMSLFLSIFTLWVLFFIKRLTKEQITMIKNTQSLRKGFIFNFNIF